MSSSRYVGRHGTSRPGPLSRLGGLPTSVGTHGARAAAKTVAGVGIVLGSGAFVIAPSSAADSVVSADLSAVSSTDTSVTDLLQERSEEPSASRSAARTTAAVTAPSRGTAAEVHESTGALAVDAVVKPAPKPKPKPKAAPVADTEQDKQSTDTEQDKQSTDTEQDAAPQAQATEVPEREESSTASRTSDRESTQQAPAGGGSPQTGNYASQAAGLGLGSTAQQVYSAVRTQFPDMTNIGGYRAGDSGDHGSGNAVDIMVSGARGDQVAAWVQANAGSLNVKYVIWKQRIWLPGSGWRAMEDRGDPTQNHFDHVHVSVN